MLKLQYKYYDFSLFDRIVYKDEIFNDYITFNRRRGGEIQENKWWHLLTSFTFSLSKIEQLHMKYILNKLGINTDAYMRGSQFTEKDGILNFHSTRGTHWVLYIIYYSFDCYEFPPLKLFQDFIITRNGKCVFQSLNSEEKTVNALLTFFHLTKKLKDLIFDPLYYIYHIKNNHIMKNVYL